MNFTSPKFFETDPIIDRKGMIILNGLIVYVDCKLQFVDRFADEI